MAARDHYSILNVGRDATLRQIEDSFRRLRVQGDDSPAARELDRAYETLRSPNLKRKYDSESAEGRIALEGQRPLGDKLAADAAPSPAWRPDQNGKPPRPPMSPATQRALLGALAATLLLVLAVSVWPRYSYLFTTFEKGHHLEAIVSGEFFGEVLAFEAEHSFPGGQRSAAYQVRLANGSEQWIPKGDLNQLARIRPRK